MVSEGPPSRDDERLLEIAAALADGRTLGPQPEPADRQTTAVLRQLHAIERLSAAFAHARSTSEREVPGGAVLFRWGHLEVLSPIGTGGFGDVYRAWDPLLHRQVALKLRRLERSSSGTDRQVEEARRLARVRHPNVLLVHGVDVHDGRPGFWCELIEGQTVETLLAERGRFGAGEAVAVGTELCRALSALHGAGIVHGDVKGANVMREQGGRIVLMDLGAAHDGRRGADDIQVTASSAADEVLRGEPPTTSSDLYSLGALLFRLLTGAHHREAPLADLRPDVPAKLVATIERALDGDPARRFSSAGSMSQALQNALSDERGEESRQQAPRRRRWTSSRRAAASGGVAAALVLAWIIATGLRQPEEVLRVSRLRPFSIGLGSYAQAAVSPDGQRVAFISDASGSPQVWVQNITGGDPRQLTRESVTVQRPAWLGDGTRIVYTAWGAIRSMSVDGQIPRSVLAGWNAHASRAGGLVLERGEELWAASNDGGDAAKVAGIPERPSRVYERLPVLSPDGSMIAFLQSTFSRWGDIWIVPAHGGEPQQLTADGKAQGRPAWAPDGRTIVYPSRRGGGLTLWQVDVGRALQHGPQTPAPLLQSDGEDTDPEFSPDGRTIFYTATKKSYSLSLFDPATGEERTLHESPLHLVAPEVSRDGQRIAFFGGGRDGEINVFTMDIAGGAARQVTSGTESVFPVWSADSRDLLFFHVGPAPSWRRVAATGGPSTVLKDGWTMSERMHVRPDPSGRQAIYTWYERDLPRATRIIDTDSGREREFHRLLRHPMFSPDGQQVLGVDASRPQARIAPLLVCPVAAGPCRALGPSAAVGRWAPDGQRVYFQRPLMNYSESELWSVDADGSDARMLLTFNSEAPYLTSFDVTPSGHLVLSRLHEGRQQLWLAELGR